jgi:hypothetical protein
MQLLGFRRGARLERLSPQNKERANRTYAQRRRDGAQGQVGIISRTFVHRREDVLRASEPADADVDGATSDGCGRGWGSPDVCTVCGTSFHSGLRRTGSFL